eukprot:7612011-Prorocentrum_lima.AAC.1
MEHEQTENMDALIHSINTAKTSGNIIWQLENNGDRLKLRKCMSASADDNITYWATSASMSDGEV